MKPHYYQNIGEDHCGLCLGMYDGHLQYSDSAALDRKMTKQVLKQIYYMKPDMVEMVAEFHRKFGITHDPKLENTDKVWLRYRLIHEETEELYEALFAAKPDKVATADALGDILYVVLGAAEAWGIDINRVFAEIHRSNMTKEGGGRRADGKILKGPNYSPPDLSFVLEPA